MSVSAFSAGQRVADAAGFRGFVRYVGPVASVADDSVVYVGTP